MFPFHNIERYGDKIMFLNAIGNDSTTNWLVFCAFDIGVFYFQRFSHEYIKVYILRCFVGII